jgi:hypothetical protein
MPEQFVEGNSLKKFRIFRLDRDSHPYECVAEYDTRAEVHVHEFRLDWQHKIYTNGRYYTWPEFRKMGSGSV